MIIDEIIYVVNVGDSRAIMSIDAGAQIGVLTRDHKPDDEMEKNRIARAGGFIIEGRVNGNLNLSRALGDHCKELNRWQWISWECTPPKLMK